MDSLTSAEEGILEAKLKGMKSAFGQRLQGRMRVEQRKKRVPWIESLDITSDNKIQLVSSQINDDIQRELLFYNLTLGNVKKGLTKLKAENVKIVRPPDFLAEMFKTDDMMQKVRNHLVRQQVKIQTFEEKKQRKDSKKFAKKLQQQKELDKVKEKKKNLAVIDKWKEQIKNKGENAPDLDEFMQKDRKAHFKAMKGSQGSKPKSFKSRTPGQESGSKKIKKGAPKRAGKVKRSQMKNSKKSKH